MYDQFVKPDPAHITLETIRQSPNRLAPAYSQFRVHKRLLLTGHSHQAWPDVALIGHLHAWKDAADYVDDKWERAFHMAERVQRGFARLLDDSGGWYSLAPNTHDLLIRFLSALPLMHRPKIITTDGEFHTIRRQIDRFAEESLLEIVRVPASPANELAQRLVDEIDEKTAVVLVSAVLFQSAEIVPDLAGVLERCQHLGAELLIDAYHALNVVPFSLPQQGLEAAFVLGGGYKYCQLGEGNCFLRTPPDCQLRPIITGWFAEFDQLSQGKRNSRVLYGNSGLRFAGATYDPTSHYRAAEVFHFFEELNLTPEFLREVSQHQIGVLIDQFDQLDLDPAQIDRNRDIPRSQLGGFLALTSPQATEIQRKLHDRGLLTDVRANILRLGPAPYLSDDQLIESIHLLGDTVRNQSV
ncbi:MAG: kynureninase [Gemmatimonadetes bacterium]|nr:MAG: kynureninase [Gemmatimonadota bacterium]